MKNLKPLFSSVHENPTLKGAECFCVGLSDFKERTEKCGYVYFYCDGVLYSGCNKTGQYDKLYDLRSYYETGDSNLESVNIEYNFITTALILALSNGDVFSFELDTNSLQCIGSVESGLKAMEFSPDMETIAFATGEDTIILMSGSFDPITEVNLNSLESGEKQMVNVGWGKKETQFHGSEGKAAAKAKSALPEISILSDDHNTRITWRGDGSLFAVSFWSEESNSRRIKIFNGEGVLQCSSETLPGLEQTIAWRPSGNLIAFMQTFPNKHVLGFIEKNGLRHGEFVLPADIEVKEICWNVESTILCLVCEKRLLLWTVGNYHWYLKQQVNYSHTNIVSARWDSSSANTLHVLTSDGTYTEHRWTWKVDRTASIAEEDGAFVGVIDGNRVLLTSFKKAVIPPPMCAYTLEFACPVNAIAFIQNIVDDSKRYSVNDVIVILSDRTVAVVSSESLSKEPKVEGTFTIDCDVDWLNNWLWLRPDVLVCCGSKPGGKHYTVALRVPPTADTANAAALTPISTIKTTLVNDPVISLTASSETNPDEIILQTFDGRVQKHQTGADLSSVSDLLSLPEQCSILDVSEGNVVALNEWNRLYWNETLLTNKATSFFVQPPYILVTSSEHSLLIFKTSDGNLCEQMSSRRLERGSKIVTVLNDSVVLQLPRGNLETIQPRALILRTAAVLLESLQYRKLFSLMRRQRIHMNLFVDHHPQVFLLTVSKFIQQVNDPALLNIFLTEMNATDVTRTIYKDFYEQDKRPQPLDKKLETVCRALRGAMTQNPDDATKLSLPILTTHVKTGEMAEALQLASQSDQALQHLLFLVDVDKLYDSAVSLYNLEMALKVAGKSQKDPKEYIPHLNSLKSMDPDYMKYTIDCHYKKYESALRNICRSPREEHFHEALQLVQNSSLYSLALDLYKESPGRYKEVAALYADHLFKKRCYEEAGLMFVRSGDLELALKAYTRSGLWRDAIVLARKLDYSLEDQRELAEALCDSLKNTESWNEAASVAVEILQDPCLAIECLVSGRLWNRAIYQAEVSGTSQYIDEMVKPHLKETATLLVDELKQNMEKLEKHAARLGQLRLEKAQKKDNPASDIDINDLQSEISSASSYGSMRSGGTQSSKNTRKMQRKMWSLKEGNPREEFALLSTITQLIQTTEKMTNEVMSTCSALVRFNNASFDSLATKLQSTMGNALAGIQKIKISAWPPQPCVNDGTASTDVMDSQLQYPPLSCIQPTWRMEMLNLNTS